MSDFALELLAFGPHPDDVELFCGGVMARAAASGYRTGIVDLTRGEMASNGTPEQRAVEAQNAAEVLGVSLRENLGLPDTWLSPWSGDALLQRERGSDSQVAKVVEVLRRLRPEMVLVPWHDARHPDHQAASELLTRALYLAGIGKFQPTAPRFVPRQVLYYQFRHRFRPSFVVDVADVYPQKRAAIACYGSQVGRTEHNTATLLNSPLAIDAIEARDRYYGAMIGISHAEPLFCRSTLGVLDPVAHFRQNNYTQPHLFERT